MNFLTIGMMIRKIKYIPTLLVLFILYGCPDSERLEDVGFGVENDTSTDVKISIYEKSTKNLIRGFGLPISNSQSIAFSLTENYLRYSEDYSPLEFTGDSAVIVLGDRYLIHKYDQMNKVFTPDEGNIFRISSYTQETPTIYRMELNQEDYDNATPCNVDHICGE
jgi:hypothetical protein